ncbi:UNVERIFIED_ORG: hypothetical protein ABID57_002147 [Arthrobacter sp. UYEF1]
MDTPRGDFDDAGGCDGGEDEHHGEHGPEAQGLGHQLAHVAAHSPVDGSDDAHGRAEHPGLQVLVEDNLGEREAGAGDALQGPAGDEQSRVGAVMQRMVPARKMLDAQAAAGVDTTDVAILPEPTGTALIVVDREDALLWVFRLEL